MTAKNLPSPELLRKLLRYEPDTGKLYWRKRTHDMFADGKYDAERSCKIWNIRFADKEAFTSISAANYACGLIFGRHYLAHRVIWAICNGDWPSEQLDHINGDRGDNRIKNLRSVSHAENGRNQKRPSNNTSGVIGVNWHKFHKKWQSCIRLDRKIIHLGYFTDKADAIAARKAAEAKYGFHPNHGRQT